MKSFHLLIISLATITASCNAFSLHAQQSKILTADKHNEYGLVYTLPTTALNIEVTAVKTVKKAGPYYQYAKKYIGTDKVVSKDSEEWTVKSISVTPYGVPDQNCRYLMQLKPGALTYIAVDENGMLRAINTDPADDKSASASASAKAPATHVGVKDFLQYVNEDFLASQSSAKQAQMLAENLMEVRDAKISLTRGTAESMPTDGKQLELMLNSLSNQEATMTAAFTGVTYTEEETRNFSYTPGEEGREILFRLSDFNGFVDSNDLSGAPVYIEVKITGGGKLPLDAKGEEKKIPKDAVMYNIPGSALISISTPGNELFSKEFDFAQFGMEFGLAPSLFSAKKERSYAIFDPATGSLLKMGLVSEE